MKEIKKFHSNKNLKLHYFINDNDKAHGIYKVFSEDNTLLSKVIFKNGAVHGINLNGDSYGINIISTGKNNNVHGTKIIFKYKKYNLE